MTEICTDYKNEVNCKYRDWFITNNFSKDYLSLKTPPKNWKKISEFPIIPGNIFDSNKELGTYTLFLKFNIPKHFLKGDKQTAIRLKGIGMVYKLYINEKFIGGEGIAKKGKLKYSRTVRNVIWEINTKHLKEKGNVLIIHLKGHPKYRGTGLYFSRGYEIGYFSELKYNAQDRIGFTLGAIYLLMGIYHVFLFSRRRKETYNLFFGLFTINVFIYFYTRTNEVFELPVDTDYVTRVEFGVLYTLLPLFISFLETLFFGKISKVNLVYSYFCGFLFFINLFFPFYLLEEPILRIWQVSAFCMFPFVVFQLFKSIRQKNRDALRVFAGTILLMISAMFDILDSAIFHTGLAFTKFTLFALIVGTAAILSNRFLDLYETVEDLNVNLEKKVEKRTKELKSSLHEIRLLKEHQDGDYFLTTLIFKPLAFNGAKIKNVFISFFLKQKKEFVFRNRKYEIGGDLCVTDTIQLYNKEFTVFINGDAMGKSIQGAGGSIVLGVVFKSILSRTKLFYINQNVFPEQWLKMTFIELQNIFESFDGSMMLSVVMGLIDNDNGMMYFINAEHPWTVLYRDKVASFIENDLSLHKLGITELKNKIRIQTFHLEDEDIILIGSDGRDDILIQNEQNSRLINEDENLFLKMVERGKGELNLIYEQIKEQGELTDDLSLLRIEYKKEVQHTHPSENKNFHKGVHYFSKGNFEDAINEFEIAFMNHAEPRIFKYLARIHYKLQNYQNAVDYYVLYVDQEPWSERDIYRTSTCFKTLGDFNKAEEYANRLRLRNPHNNKYLLNLIDIYIHTNKKGKARKLLKRILETEPENRVAISYKNLI